MSIYSDEFMGVIPVL